MLAALIATRPVTPPPPSIVAYGNQLVAATTTFSCITITTRAAALTTSLPIRYQLNFSLPGHESILDQLNRMYYRLISPSADDDPAFLSRTIAQVIAIVVALNGIVQSLPVAAFNASTLAQLQQRLSLALRILNSLAIPPNRLSFA